VTSFILIPASIVLLLLLWSFVFRILAGIRIGAIEIAALLCAAAAFLTGILSTWFEIREQVGEALIYEYVCGAMLLMSVGIDPGAIGIAVMHLWGAALRKRKLVEGFQQLATRFSPRKNGSLLFWRAVVLLTAFLFLWGAAIVYSILP
jgi:hypothetical protein